MIIIIKIILMMIIITTIMMMIMIKIIIIIMITSRLPTRLHDICRAVNGGRKSYGKWDVHVL